MNTKKLMVVLIILIAGVALYFIFNSIISPDMYKKMDRGKPLGYVFVPDDDEFETRNHFLLLNLIPFTDVEIKGVYAKYKKKDESYFQTVSLTNVNKGINWVGELPKLSKGQRYFYYFEIEYIYRGKNQSMFIPDWAPDKPLLYVTYEGKPNKFLLVLHIVMVIGAAIFLLHALFYAASCLLEKDKTKYIEYFDKSFKTTLSGWILFTVSTLFIGYYISYQVFGKGWTGLPVGDDITDNKSLFTMIYWGLVLLLRSNNKLKFIVLNKTISIRTFCIMVIIGALLTTVVFLIPHSCFFQ
jgi:hypothetical protein